MKEQMDTDLLTEGRKVREDGDSCLCVSCELGVGNSCQEKLVPSGRESVLSGIQHPMGSEAAFRFNSQLMRSRYRARDFSDRSGVEGLLQRRKYGF